jgi:hypothetical protein
VLPKAMFYAGVAGLFKDAKGLEAGGAKALVDPPTRLLFEFENS